MIFLNKPNPLIETVDGRKIFHSRSVAVDCTVVARIYKEKEEEEEELYILCSTRGPKASDFQGRQNLVTGYLDWGETAIQAAIRETWEETGLNLYEIIHGEYDVIKMDLMQPWEVSSSPTNNNENVSLRFGLLVEVLSLDELPKLTTEHNEVVGECENPIWMKLSDMSNYHWAFNHEMVIFGYLSHLAKARKIDLKVM